MIKTSGLAHDRHIVCVNRHIGINVGTPHVFLYIHTYDAQKVRVPLSYIIILLLGVYDGSTYYNIDICVYIYPTRM